MLEDSRQWAIGRGCRRKCGLGSGQALFEKIETLHFGETRRREINQNPRVLARKVGYLTPDTTFLGA